MLRRRRRRNPDSGATGSSPSVNLDLWLVVLAGAGLVGVWSGYHSYMSVRLEKAICNSRVQETANSLAAASGAPISYNTVTGESTFNISTFQSSASADGTSDTVEKIQSDWIDFYVSWQSFYAAGTDQTSTLGFPNFPDGSEWSTLMQYEATLATLQGRISALYPSASITVITPPEGTTASFGSLFPSLNPGANASLTSLVWIGGALAAFYYLPPMFQGAASAWKQRSSAPRSRRLARA